MYDELYRTLKDIARRQTTIHYEDIAPMLDLDIHDPADRVRIGQILGDISRKEHDVGRPMLSAVVTLKGDERPGTGFFELGQELGLAAGTDNERFFIRELKRLHAYWAQHLDNN